MLDISIVIPLKDEAESLPELETWIRKVMQAHGFQYELIFIDDGSRDNSWQIIKELRAVNPHIKAFKFRRNYGKSAGLQVGFTAATGRVVFTMDADLQDSPDELPEMYRMITEGNLDLVSGWKKVRHDPISKTIPTKLYNAVTRGISGIKLHDFNCGLKAYRLDVVKSIEVYGDMHRYLPVIAKWAGFSQIGEKVVEHRARKYGQSKFGLERFINGPLDLMSIWFVGRFGRRPMHFFGTMGTFCFMVGFAILFFLSYGKLVNNEYKMHDRPLFYGGILALIIGSQMFMTGFLGEMINNNNPNRHHYLIQEEIG
jgi:glycosyltransferase involved in cell wall biosynthesis